MLGVDLFGDTDAVEACVRHVCLERFDDLASLPPVRGGSVMQVGGFEGERGVLEQLSQRYRLLGPSIAMRTELDDPRYLRHLAGESGLRFPVFSSVGRSPDGQWLIKRTGHSGGIGVSWASDANVERLPAPEGYLQEWIGGRPLGATFLCDGESARLLGVCRSIFTRAGGRPFLYAGSFGPVRLPDQSTRSLQRLGEWLNRQGMLGLCNVDVILDRDGECWLLEVNARWSGSSEVVERSLQSRGALGAKESLIEKAWQACRRSAGALMTGDESTATAGHSTLKRIVYARRDCRIDRKRLATGVADWTGRPFPIELCDLPADQTIVKKGEPILSVIATFEAGERRLPRGTSRRLREWVRFVQANSGDAPEHPRDTPEHPRINTG